MTDTLLFADHAYLPDGWRRNVLLRWDAAGTLTGVTPDTDAPAGVARARGPCCPVCRTCTRTRSSARWRAHRIPRESVRQLLELARPDVPLRAEDHARRARRDRALAVEMLSAATVCEFHVHHAGRLALSADRRNRHARDRRRARAGIGITMLPVSYQFAGFGDKPPRDDQRRFINTPDGLLELLDAMRRVAPEHGGLRYGVAPHSLRAVSENGLRVLLAGLPDDAPCISISPSRRPKSTTACVRTARARAMAARSLRRRCALVSRARRTSTRLKRRRSRSVARLPACA